MTPKEIKMLARQYAVERLRNEDAPDWPCLHGMTGDAASYSIFLAELLRIADRIERTIAPSPTPDGKERGNG
jgi:hypothetical protein